MINNNHCNMNIELSIIILARNEADNLELLIPRIKSTMEPLSLNYEILILDGNSSDNTVELCRSFGCRVVLQKEPAYGNAFRQAFKELRGRYAINIDADCSHNPGYIVDLWSKRGNSQLVIASRYIKGGKASMPISRKVLSIILNRIYSFILSLPYKDLSSSFRLYQVESVRGLIDDVKAKDFNILLEVLIKLHCNGYYISEIPFFYQPRHYGSSSVKLFKFCLSYLKTLYYSWQLRNSAFSADYDDRAFNSIIPLQKYWQRKRYKIIMGMVEKKGCCIDLGCGSSKVIQNLPQAVGLDIDLKKLRYLKKTNQLLIKGSIGNLPFKNDTSSEIICSQVIEHIPKENLSLKEFYRVLKKDGYLIIGTPDYATFWWRFFEWFYIRLLPLAYGEGHISHYNKEELCNLLEESGFKIINYQYICRAELIIKAQKYQNEY